MPNVRPPAVAGMFYPAEAAVLRAQVEGYLGDAKTDSHIPKAVIVPHAGYIYSGPIAASAYAAVRALRGQVKRVVLLGPAHRVFVRGLAASSAAAFDTPLGRIPIDRTTVDDLLTTFPFVTQLDAAHAAEHSLEVQLPFLQETLADFELVPLVVGDARHEDVARVLEHLWDGPQTLVVISSDLSHYHNYATATAMDRAAADAIERLDPEQLDPEQACGCTAVRGLLETARHHGLQAHTVDLRNSGDTAGPRDEVVGYGAWLFY